MAGNKNQLRRARKKAQKAEAANAPVEKPQETDPASSLPPSAPIKEDVSSVAPAAAAPADDDPLWEMYKGLVTKFDETGDNAPTKESEKPEVFFDDEDEIPDEEETDEPKISKKKRKELNKLSVAELKAMVHKPEIVEWTDTSASDPRLLIHLKAHRNVVPVPSHWSLKREYLSSKRGVEKAPFVLPKFIQETGISEMRDATLDKQDASSLKQKQRERVAPKMGKLDIDYQKLYEAFFRFQTKPELTRYGEIYYEGKEYETNLKHLHPGDLSDELKEALNMPPGAPPPWLINQQRYGPPPSYPALKIPGLNAPPPAGRSMAVISSVFYNLNKTSSRENPLRKIFGENCKSQKNPKKKVTRKEMRMRKTKTKTRHRRMERILRVAWKPPGGIASAVPSEIGTTENISGEFDVRKHHRGTETEESVQPRSAYQVIPERQANVQGFFGGDRTYDLSQSSGNPPLLGADDQNRKRKKPGDVEVSVDLDALQAGDGLNKDNLQNLYESERQQQNQPQWGFQEDLSDMIAQESRKRLRKDEERKGKR
ncbi:hypothetical protein N7533_001851 [Penicillium manginii]|uniref:uncharacterized protein n=1 Tax=Penicillium manginii TaxID=203109 RepID=UPI0025488A02|nr:uncharacterized protein N7533_001851 [Penicillium manginii]KAJ5763170.1 hypothetical protein N7533_001851 [Penicillium manginii]